MPERIEKSITELDFDTVNFYSGQWTWGCGGHPLTDDEYSITHFAVDNVVSRYRLPECLNYIIRRSYNQGYQDALENARKALGI